MAARRLGNHRTAEIYPYHPPVWTNQLRQGLYGLACPTPDVKNMEPFVQRKLGEHHPPDLLDVFDGAASIKKADKKMWVCLLIHHSELGNIATFVHGMTPCHAVQGLVHDITAARGCFPSRQNV